MRIFALSLLSLFALSCQSQEPMEESRIQIPEVLAEQIDEYVVETYRDSKGHLWFGTLEKGVAKYDGTQLVYLTINDGLPSNRVVCVREDAEGRIWLATGEGLSMYNGETFFNFSVRDGLVSNMLSYLHFDSHGLLWIGSWKGLCTFDGQQFKVIPLPFPEVETPINPDTKDWIPVIIEDHRGTIWVGRDGYGICKIDGKVFTPVTTKDGLNSNHVQALAVDDQGNVWIGTRLGEEEVDDAEERNKRCGLNLYNGKNIVQFPEVAGVNGVDIYGIYWSPSKQLWIGTVKNGVYRYADQTFEHYELSKSTMTFAEDQKGQMWLGCAGGLYRIDGEGKVENITTSGPWE